MLTNNKKSTFIKSIAMIMAVLMVLAVALTGCGNKAAEEAATKAENAQNTADEAKTAAQAVADALSCVCAKECGYHHVGRVFVHSAVCRVIGLSGKGASHWVACSLVALFNILAHSLYIAKELVVCL